MKDVDVLLFQNRYRIPSARSSGRDYGLPGRYFVTICTKHREPWFGEIRNGVMGLSDAGCIVHACWKQIPVHYSYITLDAFVVMPNHVHGIIIINGSDGRVETPHAASLPNNTHKHHEWKSGCLGAIVNQFKSACTKYIHRAGYHDFAWQPRFHDHIIRNDTEYRRIRWYIIHNPHMWHRDRNNWS